MHCTHTMSFWLLVYFIFQIERDWFCFVLFVCLFFVINTTFQNETSDYKTQICFRNIANTLKQKYTRSFKLLQRCSQCLPTEPPTRSIKLRKKVRKNWGKMEENNRGMRTNEEMFLSCPPEVESLATPLMVFMIKRTVGKSSNHHSTSEMVDVMYIFFIDVSISKAVICMEHVNNFDKPICLWSAVKFSFFFPLTKDAL